MFSPFICFFPLNPGKGEKVMREKKKNIKNIENIENIENDGYANERKKI
jgi:hypothetical protein